MKVLKVLFASLEQTEMKNNNDPKLPHWDLMLK